MPHCRYGPGASVHGVSALVAGDDVLGPAWRSVGSGGLVGRACEGVGEAGEVCGRASGAAAGPKVQPADGLGLAHSHVGQAQGAEVLCACAGAARRSTAAGAGAAAGGGSEPMWVPCLRVWAA